MTTAEGLTSTYQVENLPGRGERRTGHDTTAAAGCQIVTLIGTDGSRTITDPDGTVTTLTLGPDPRFGMLAPLIRLPDRDDPGRADVDPHHAPLRHADRPQQPA